MEVRKNDKFFEQAGHRTIFHELINSPHLPPAEKETIRVIQEAGAIVGRRRREHDPGTYRDGIFLNR